MSSTLATRPAPTSARRRIADQPVARRTSDSGASVLGRADRPRLRIVADDEHAPVLTRIPAAVEVDPELDAPLRRVAVDDFYATDGRSTRLRVTGPVRLTRRGQVAVAAVALLAFAGAGVLAAQGSAAETAPAGTRVVTVAPGESLWSISAGVASGADSGDVRGALQQIQRLNHLDTATVVTGQHLVVPAG